MSSLSIFSANTPPKTVVKTQRTEFGLKVCLDFLEIIAGVNARMRRSRADAQFGQAHNVVVRSDLWGKHGVRIVSVS